MDDPLRPARQKLLASRADRGEPVEDDARTLDPANEEAGRIYMLVRNQVVTVGDGRPIDLNLTAVKAAMDMHGVTDQRDCLARVVRVWREIDAERWRDASQPKEQP